MSKIPDTALITINEELAKQVTRPKFKVIVDAFDGGKEFLEGLKIAAANFTSGKAKGFTEDPVAFLRPYATRLVAEGALTWNQSDEEKAAGLGMPKPRAVAEPKLDENGNPIEKPKRSRRKKAEAAEQPSTEGQEPAAEGDAPAGEEELPPELAAEG